MKKTLKIISGFAMVTLLLMGACVEKSEKPKDEPPAAPEIVYAPKQIISLADADSLYENYSKRRTECVMNFEMGMQDDDDKPFVPTRFVSFDLDVIKNYIAYIEQEAKKGGTKVDGLRIYLGNYGDTEKGWKKKRRNTVFIVPEAEAEGGSGGIYIGKDGEAKLIRNLFNAGQESEPRSKASFMPSLNTNLVQPGGKSLTLNFGQGGPPPTGDF